jgi:HAD superfamily hydrolase (TIGR01490 family)
MMRGVVVVSEPRARAAAFEHGGDVALFDLDRTLIPGSSIVSLARGLVADGIVRRRALVPGMVANVVFAHWGASDATADRLRARALTTMAGVERSPLLGLAEEVGHHLVGTMYPGARWLVERHLEAGHFCAVVSAAPQELVDAFVRALGVHRGVGTRGEVVDGRFTGRLEGEFCYGPGKVLRVAQELGDFPRLRTTAYADSASDIPLLRAACHRVAVNPDRTLGKLARRAAWPIVRLR